MKHRPFALRSLRLAALAAAAALSGLPVLSQAAMVNTSAPLSAAAPREPAWWAALHEPALDALIETARRRALIGLPAPGSDEDAAQAPLAARITGLYIGTRVTSVRLMLAQSLAESIAQQRKLLAGEGPRQAAAGVLAQLDARAAVARSLVQHLAAQQSQLIAALAQLCTVPAGELAAALAPALANRAAPAINVAVEGAGDEALPAVARLQASMRAAEHLSQAVNARQLELDAVRRRAAIGEASQYELLESFQRLLADGDRLVTAQGVMTMEWVELRAAAGVVGVQRGVDDL